MDVLILLAFTYIIDDCKLINFSLWYTLYGYRCKATYKLPKKFDVPFTVIVRCSHLFSVSSGVTPLR